MRPKRIKPVEAAAEKYSFFLDSFFLLVLILFKRILMSVLFVLAVGLSVDRYLEINLSLTLSTVFFTFIFKHFKAKFANFSYKER